MDADGPNIPRKLEQELRSAFGSTQPTDLGVIEAGAARMRAVRRRRWALRAGPLAAAAGLALAAWLLWPGAAWQTRLDQHLASGRPDILDAFALARAVDRQSPPNRFDLTGDGVVDRHDVDAVAALAVRLDGGAS